MEVLLIIGGVFLLLVVFSKSSNKRKKPSDSSTYSSPGRLRKEQNTEVFRQSPRPRSNAPIQPPVSRPKKKQNTETFRPSSRPRSSSSISFKTPSSTSNASSVPAAVDLEGLHDAFTGAPLDKGLGLHQCQSCKVYYHTESLQVLRELNESQCVACQSKNIIGVIASGKATGGKDYTPNIVTLHNYRQHEGSVVTFEGRVHKVNESRRGNDFAVMFEDKSWVRGFKLVFFRGAVRKVGGATYINSLAGKKVKVRGLVIKHPEFGFEIIVSEKSMVLSAE